MADPRYRYSGHSGRRSPTYNPARASLPANVGYNSHYTGDVHAVPTARYDATVPRRAHEHKANPPTATITTYNITKDPVARSTSRTGTGRHRSSTIDAAPPVKPIIVTTNHHSRPHGSSSHTSSSARATSPSRDPYRSSEETYYAQPASSIRARSQHRHSHSYSQSATLGDEFYRLRERVGGDDRLRAPVRAGTVPFGHSRPHSTVYANTANTGTTAVADYEDEGYEYTKPSDLARYDLDHGRDQRRSRRDSVDRPYYRPHVNVSSDTARYDARSRAKPPTSAAIDRFNRAAASGIYDRPSVTMPSLPVVPAPPPVEAVRRPAPVEGTRSPSVEPRVSRPRPVSLYQETPARMSHADDLYRSRDDERIPRDRREREEGYRDDNIAARGFGLRTDTFEQPIRPASAITHRDFDDRRARRDVADREPKRRSDESLDRTRAHERRPIDEPRPRVEGSRDRRESVSRRNSISRAREKVATGLSVAAAAMGLAATKADDDRTSPKRRESDDEKEAAASHPADKYKPRDSVLEHKPSLREDPIVVEQRREARREEPRRDEVRREEPRRDEARREPRREEARRDEPRKDEARRDEPRREEPRKERPEPRSGSRERDLERERERDSEREQREREKETDRERDQRDRELEREREHERHRRESDARLGGMPPDRRDGSPTPDASENAARRRHRPAAAFNPTDTKGLMDLKAELAAIDGQDRLTEKSAARATPSDKDTGVSASSHRADVPSESREPSPRGRDAGPSREDKQVRVLSPPRDKGDQKPIKGILKQPKVKFPEDNHPIREGVAPHKDDKTKKDVPPGARWTRIHRKMVNPEALTIGKERFEVRDNFVIVLRVLSKDEVQAYAVATQQLRARRNQEAENGVEHERLSDEERNRSDEERQRRHRHRREHGDDEYQRERDAEGRNRRHRHGSDSDETEIRPKAIEYDGGSSSSHHHVRPQRDYESVASSDDRR
ncbi:Uu.00g114600.m01.CDS01 [Anthostomella pinea]|uniref:Uu.00g114600.m01.CDS01 n=1 Tax=Anthostomella pinea TaxID=933095 RepID=A0AAI8YGN9_9PEZI|nr:Uu.00g114600.m01.CDS01 [Anthostomella pinea]